MPWPFNDAGEPMCDANQYRRECESDFEPDYDDDPYSPDEEDENEECEECGELVDECSCADQEDE